MSIEVFAYLLGLAIGLWGGWMLRGDLEALVRALKRADTEG